MCLCGNMWRWPNGASEGTMLLLLLGLSLVQAGSAQLTCQAGESAQNITQPQYNNMVQKNSNADFLMPFVRSFLGTVQPHPFPTDLILRVVNNPGEVFSNQELTKAILVYEVGFLVCIAIGILYIVLMPIIAFFVACCRCCGNCGGKMQQKQTSSTHCLRRTLYFSLFSITIIILAGNVCMFRSNEAFKLSVEQSPLELKNTIGDMSSFLTAVPQQVEDVTNEGKRTVQAVSRNLNDIGQQVGEKIQQRFSGTFNPALQAVKLLHQESLNTSDLLDKLNSSLTQLQSSLDIIQANVTAFKGRIQKTLSKPGCVNCGSLAGEVEELTVDATISAPSLREYQSAVDDVIKGDLQSNIIEAEKFYSTIPQRVTNETEDLVTQSKQQLQEIENQISQVSNELDLSALRDVTGTLDQVQNQIETVSPEVQRFENIRWAVGVALCCVVLLVVVCNILGLVLGPLGLSPKADPANRSCTSDCGGIFFMMGAGFSFLFSWIFMILVVLLFILGGNMYTLICRPWHNGQLLKFLDTPGLIPQLELGPALGLKTDINLSDIYRDCKENQPLWTTLHLHELVDLADVLNVSKYTAQIEEEFEKTDITLSSVSLLSPEIIKGLQNVAAEATDFNSTAVTQQLNDISSINLNSTADKIDQLADTQPPGIQGELKVEASKLRQIQADIETTIFPQVNNLNSSMKSLQSTTGKINGTVEEVLSKVGAAQDFLNTNTTQIVKTESRRFLNCQVDYFSAYADWTTIMITQQVGRCEPVARAIDSADVVLCVNMVESLNAFWFSLGWCMMFFIPSIILSMKLAKYYRRMKYTDVFENPIIMNHIPRAQLKPT
ncbi:prominin-2 [Cyprinodon tularosa]|uniref:prominin-2 n=1 Tax=Cyprinodon tularosa TaxID=77115 RepID=UPI0018E27B30|nr:prominin-2 [Cyprinodon tularosa]